MGIFREILKEGIVIRTGAGEDKGEVLFRWSRKDIRRDLRNFFFENGDDVTPDDATPLDPGKELLIQFFLSLDEEVKKEIEKLRTALDIIKDLRERRSCLLGVVNFRIRKFRRKER